MGLVQSKGYDYIALKRLEEGLLEKYNFLKSFCLGRSCLGRDINALKIGNSSEYTLIAAAFHGSEYITTTVLMFFIEELCEALQKNGSIAGFRAKKALYTKGVIFVPQVNPDGCEISMHGGAGAGSLTAAISKIAKNDFIHWNANARGVDINHNFSAGWHALKKAEQKAGIFGPAPTRYGGAAPESEPETLALTELCRTRNIRHVTALHSQGEVIYWHYGKNQPARAQKMAEIMATASGYELSSPEGLALGGGFKDWFIEEFCRPGFTVELGLGENPLPEETAYDIYGKVREMLMLTTIM